MINLSERKKIISQDYISEDEPFPKQAASKFYVIS
jgi:hypothetical protein